MPPNTSALSLVGIDEAGRGPIAGPVAVGVVAVRDRAALAQFSSIRESKQLTPHKREAWCAVMREESGRGTLALTVSCVGPAFIDTHGIVEAIRVATARSLARLNVPSDALILLDGGLRAGARFAHQRTIVRGDESETIIAMASVAAKVVRDGKMNAYAERYPDYGFERHKGYGTSSHLEAVARSGMTPIHRRSFLGRHLGER